MLQTNIPLSERIRPTTIDSFIGQSHLLGKQGILRRMLESKQVRSVILWGPPGVGKTTIAQIIAQQAGKPFSTLSAISAGVKEVREVIARARTRPGTVLFIDEIHRFNKSQQDALLGAVEKGIITLIGATTENPSFEINAALLSRCQVYTLKSFTKEELTALLKQAVETDDVLRGYQIELKETEALFRLAGGDARRLLNLLDLVVSSAGVEKIVLTDELVISVAQQKSVLYDKNGEQHYDIVSAFIKSLRGSDPNAAIYWMARMLEGGEDPKFIARRMLIMAAEDIGNANPTALVMATNAFQSVTFVGMPESEIILAQVVVYLACSPKSNASYLAIKQARKFVRETGDLPIPMHLRNAPTKLMKQQGYGKDYKYSHDFPNNFVEQNFLPTELEGHKFYEPGQNPRENEMRKRLQALWKDKYKY